MTGHAQLAGWPDAGADRRPLPPVYDRVAVLIAGVTHLTVLAGVAEQRHEYRSFAGMLLLVLVSAAIPLACVLAARTSGRGLTGRAFLVAGAAMVLVAGAQALVLPRAETGGLAALLWEATGVNILILSAYRPPRDVLGLGAVATIPVLLLLGPQLGPSTANIRFLAAFSSVVMPPLAAGQYLRQYLESVRLRTALADRMARAASREEALELVQRDSRQRLEAAREQALPLLSAVSRGDLAPDDPAVTQQARELAATLRAELIRGRSGEWLIHGGDQAGRDDRAGSPDWPGITVLDPENLLARLPPPVRAQWSVFLEVLRRHPSWEQVSLALTTGSAPRSVIVTVVARGTSARAAADDLTVRSAAAALAAPIDLDADDVLTAETELGLDGAR